MIYNISAMVVYSDSIEAIDEEEAFEIASDAAMSGGCWSREVTLIEDEEDDWEMRGEE